MLSFVDPAWSAEAKTDTRTWYPFELRRDAAPAGLDVGALLFQTPAGKHGFLRSAGEHFQFDDGERARFWGINLTEQSGFPDKTGARELARHFRQLGFNLVRFHHINVALIDPRYDDSQHLSREALDRLDYFLYQLKQNGIYANLNLLTNRWLAYKPGDGIVGYKLLAFKQTMPRYVHLYDRRLIELQKQWARDFLLHRNPYTKTRYVDEPSIAFVELINEASFAGTGESAQGDLGSPAEGDLKDARAFYGGELDRLFNTWLARKYADDAALRSGWGTLGPGESLTQSTVKRLATKRQENPTQRAIDTAQFYLDTESAYYREMVPFLRETLGFKGRINGTNNWFGLGALSVQRLCDYTDIHGYVNHPIVPQGWREARRAFTIQQYAAVNYPEGYSSEYPPEWPNLIPIHKWALGAVAGMPVMSGEGGWAYPNLYNYEAPLLLSAYAAFQELAGFCKFNYAGPGLIGDGTARGAIEPNTLGFFNLDYNPAHLTQMPAAAILFLRGDVRPAAKTLTLEFHQAEVARIALQHPKTLSHYYDPPVPPSAAIVHKVRKAFVEHPSGETIDYAALARELTNPYRSDTGELVWDSGQGRAGVVTIDVDRAKAAIGFIADRTIDLPPVTLRPRTNGALSLVSLDGRPIAESADLLLTAVARQENSGQVWRDDYKTLLDWGHAPVLLERFMGEVEIRGASGFDVEALDGSAHHQARFIARPSANGVVRLDLGAPAPWYRLRRLSKGGP